MINAPVKPRLFCARRFVSAIVGTGVASIAILHAQAPERQVTQSVTATLTLQPRASLQVSTRMLRFEVSDDAASAATASLDFSAGVRAAKTETIALVVESVREDPGVLSIVAGSDGTIAGEVVRAKPTIAARWSGGGLRDGRLTFRLQGVPPGTYDIPLSVALTIH